ncbi:MAG: hypothetical protein K940chlam2_01169 [Chlamydiae bacterium]|nr:hypothetical protein [Chlamydiota bacterium]
METPAFFIALQIHLLGLILGLGSVVVTDLFGVLWLLDNVRFTQIIRISSKTEKFIWAGWLIMVGAGIPLVLIKGFVDNLMVMKLFFVGLIAINGVFLHFIHKALVSYRHGADVPKLTMFRLILGITVSQIAWWSAFVIGFLHRHVQTRIDWPDHPYLMCVLILSAMLIIWGIGEKVFKNHVGKS